VDLQDDIDLYYDRPAVKSTSVFLINGQIWLIFSLKGVVRALKTDMSQFLKEYQILKLADHAASGTMVFTLQINDLLVGIE
jgi:hypothetical protein